MKLVYICSPLRGEPEKNIAKANEYAREEAMKGNCAIAPHCVFTQFLDDEVPEERWLGQEMGKELLCRCDELLVAAVSFRKECVRKSKPHMRMVLLFWAEICLLRI